MGVVRDFEHEAAIGARPGGFQQVHGFIERLIEDRRPSKSPPSADFLRKTYYYSDCLNS